jgi:hypothetical protein
LHEEIVDGSATIDAEGVEWNGFGLDGLKDVGDLERDGLKSGAGDVAGRGATAQADEHAAGMGVPVRRAEADKGRDEDDSACVWDAGRESLDIG